jgi:hypothetical protein
MWPWMMVTILATVIDGGRALRAARHGRSMEAEAREILAEAVREPADSAGPRSGSRGVSRVTAGLSSVGTPSWSMPDFSAGRRWLGQGCYRAG